MKKVLLGAVIAALLFLVAGYVLSYIRPGPLPTSLVTELEHLNELGQRVQTLIGRAKNDSAPQSLTKVQADYENVQVSVNQALQHVNDGLTLNALDAADVQSSLRALEPRAIALQDQLVPLSTQLVKADMLGNALEYLWKFVDAGTKPWADVTKDRVEMRQDATAMVKRMLWPDWDQIPKKSMLQGL